MKVVKEFFLKCLKMWVFFLCLILFFRERFNGPHLEPKPIAEFKSELGLQSL